jgi:hypothetical protein
LYHGAKKRQAKPLICRDLRCFVKCLRNQDGFMPMNPIPTIPIRTIVVFPLLSAFYGFAPFSRFACFSPVLPNSWRISWRFGDYLIQ